MSRQNKIGNATVVTTIFFSLLIWSSFKAIELKNVVSQTSIAKEKVAAQNEQINELTILKNRWEMAKGEKGQVLGFLQQHLRKWPGNDFRFPYFDDQVSAYHRYHPFGYSCFLYLPPGKHGLVLESTLQNREAVILNEDEKVLQLLKGDGFYQIDVNLLMGNPTRLKLRVIEIDSKGIRLDASLVDNDLPFDGVVSDYIREISEAPVSIAFFPPNYLGRNSIRFGERATNYFSDVSCSFAGPEPEQEYELQTKLRLHSQGPGQIRADDQQFVDHLISELEKDNKSGVTRFIFDQNSGCYRLPHYR